MLHAIPCHALTMPWQTTLPPVRLHVLRAVVLLRTPQPMQVVSRLASALSSLPRLLLLQLLAQRRSSSLQRRPLPLLAAIPCSPAVCASTRSDKSSIYTTNDLTIQLWPLKSTMRRTLTRLRAQIVPLPVRRALLPLLRKQPVAAQALNLVLQARSVCSLELPESLVLWWQHSFSNLSVRCTKLHREIVRGRKTFGSLISCLLCWIIQVNFLLHFPMLSYHRLVDWFSTLGNPTSRQSHREPCTNDQAFVSLLCNIHSQNLWENELYFFTQLDKDLWIIAPMTEENWCLEDRNGWF